jgi:hypothetical protein
MKKYNLYYGTEENAYEIDKIGPKSLSKALDTMQKWIEEEGEEFDRNACEKMLSERGYDYEDMENMRGYHIIIGIAEEGNSEVEDYLNDCRNVFIGEFDDFDNDNC